MNGADAVLGTLADNGVEACFANPGTSEMHFVAALDSVAGMRPVLGLLGHDAQHDRDRDRAPVRDRRLQPWHEHPLAHPAAPRCAAGTEKLAPASPLTS